MVMVDGHTITAAFGGNQLLLFLYPAIHVVIGQLRPPPSQGLRRPLGCPWAVRTVGVLSQQSGRAKAGLIKGVRK